MNNLININNNSTLIILDWDDTLFPTSWINKNNIEFLSQKNKEILYKKFFYNLDIHLITLFEKMLKCGDIIIITNALLNWIATSMSILPKLSNLLNNTDRIKIVSARGDFLKYTNDMTNWKKMAFKREVELINKNKKINNIISIGDAEYEYFALINLYDKNNFKLLKAVKFKRYPDIIEIDEQIQIMIDNIDNICTHTSHLDLYFKNK
jgi:hypothetical protein